MRTSIKTKLALTVHSRLGSRSVQVQSWSDKVSSTARITHKLVILRMAPMRRQNMGPQCTSHRATSSLYPPRRGATVIVEVFDLSDYLGLLRASQRGGHQRVVCNG